MHRVRRVTACAGLGAVFLFVASFGAVDSTPESGWTGAHVLLWTSDHRRGLLVGSWCLQIAFALSLVFIVGLCVMLRSGRTEHDAWVAIAFATGVATFVLAAVGQAFIAELAFRSRQHGPDTAKLLVDLHAALLNASNVMTVPLLLSLGIAILLVKTLPGWVAWTAFVVAVSHFLATFSWAHNGIWSPTGLVADLPGPLFLLWMGATSVALLLRVIAESKRSGRPRPRPVPV